MTGAHRRQNTGCRISPGTQAEHPENPQILYDALNFIAKHTSDSIAFGDKNVYLGEFGIPANKFSPERIKKVVTGSVETA